MIRIREIALPFDHDAAALAGAVARKLGIGVSALRELTVIRRAIDARKKRRILAVYTVHAAVDDEAAVLSRLAKDGHVTEAPSMAYVMPTTAAPSGSAEMGDKGNLSHTEDASCRFRSTLLQPIIVGSGPCGLMAALVLAQAGLKPVLIERGKDVTARVKDVQAFWKSGVLNPESNVPFGEGGAGTFSDGKLTTQIKDKHNRVRKVLQEFVAAGAPEEILYQAKPHIGTDNLVRVVRHIRETIIELGGTVRFETKLTGIEIRDGAVTAAVLDDGETIATDTLVLAIGHSARDTFEMLHAAGVTMTAKPFSLGVRIEHPQGLIDTAQYGEFAGHPKLGAAEYKLVAHCENGRSAYTFCMCPGGEVIASSSEPGQVVTNGMSIYRRNRANANSALLVGVTPDDFDTDEPLAGIEFQRRWERAAFELGGGNYNAPVQLVGDFLSGKASTKLGKVAPSYTPGVTPCDLTECLPGFVSETLRLALPQLDKKLRGFAMDDAVMTAVESRSSCPLRMVRDETLQSVGLRGLYPGGEGAGYAGGIVSAAVDGIKIAEAVCHAL